MKEENFQRIAATITALKLKAPEGTWVICGVIELPCTYFLYGPLIHRNFVRSQLEK